jgi:predicted phosphoadenosine phosphosulfate sulfurtransferase
MTTAQSGMKRYTGTNVFDAAVSRLISLYEEGHTVVLAFSAGKDSGVCLELMILAAEATGRLPVQVIMRDEEIMLPGTYEYAERVAQRPEVDFRWVVANQPVINAFNRTAPYFWVFDPLLPPSKWVRTPPSFAEHIHDKHINALNTSDRFPLPDGKWRVTVTGLRTEESARRKLGLHSMKRFYTKGGKDGLRMAWPIYDWKVGDVWRAVREFGWDYNRAYDTMTMLGIPPRQQRIGPPTMTATSVSESLLPASKAWPGWWERVCDRLPGVRQAANFGAAAIFPRRRTGETWAQTYQRECIDDAPAEWIAERARYVAKVAVDRHRRHSREPYPETKPCLHCIATSSWKKLTRAMYSGDPFGMRVDGYLSTKAENPLHRPYIDPEFFRPGAGTWGEGKPSW